VPNLEYLKDARKKQGITQEELAKVIGKERSNYARKERGTIPLSLGEFISILRYIAELDSSSEDKDKLVDRMVEGVLGKIKN